MLRVLLRSVCVTGHHPGSVYEAAKCDTVLALRAANGVGFNHFSTGSVCLCENKDVSVPSPQDLKTNAEKEEISAQTQLVEEKQEVAVDEGVSQVDVHSEKTKQAKAGAAKSGNESLLKLLGAMKVDVTNKRKLNLQKMNKTQDMTNRQNPIVAAMFQKALEETSIRAGGSVNLIENKDVSVPSPQNLKTNAEKKKISAQTQLVEEKQEVAVDEGVSQVDVHSEKTKQATADAAKSGKEGLLKLLGAMKVDVTNKRKLNLLKMNKTQEMTNRQNPTVAAMFQKALEETSIRAGGSVNLIENKDVSVPSPQNLKTNAEKKKIPAQTQLVEEKQEVAVDEGVSQVDVHSGKTKQATADAAKSGNEGLLKLLGAMKVGVTDKRKLNLLKMNKTQEMTNRQNPTVAAMFQKAKEEAPIHSEELNPELVAAASAAASTLPNPRQAHSELLRQLRKRKAMSDAQRKETAESLGNVIADMKVGKVSRKRRFDDDQWGVKAKRRGKAEKPGVSESLKKRLLIFSDVSEEDAVESTEPTLWDVEFAHEITQSINQIPRNSFEELIQWTKEDKLWAYPINNEAGLEEEANVPFHEHIFLEKHLEEGFPRQGPVRHFMELVVGGLSRNPHLRVEQKTEHIAWFREYFHQKEDVLLEADVVLN